jgi:hypothetical protein
LISEKENRKENTKSHLGRIPPPSAHVTTNLCQPTALLPDTLTYRAHAPVSAVPALCFLWVNDAWVPLVGFLFLNPAHANELALDLRLGCRGLTSPDRTLPRRYKNVSPAITLMLQSASGCLLVAVVADLVLTVRGSLAAADKRRCSSPALLREPILVTSGTLANCVERIRRRGSLHDPLRPP